ncbi:hypothetical protein DFH09DRAFT_1277372 [Mycena vulgaris]|nr:hypothetical protein DFH09DRAFT_1277372 [Mycena vulgaris]
MGSHRERGQGKNIIAYIITPGRPEMERDSHLPGWETKRRKRERISRSRARERETSGRKENKHSMRGWLDTRRRSAALMGLPELKMGIEDTSAQAGEIYSDKRRESVRERESAADGGSAIQRPQHSLEAAQRARGIPRGVDLRDAMRRAWVDREGESAEDGAGIEDEDGRDRAGQEARCGGRGQEGSAGDSAETIRT